MFVTVGLHDLIAAEARAPLRAIKLLLLQLAVNIIRRSNRQPLGQTNRGQSYARCQFKPPAAYTWLTSRPSGDARSVTPGIVLTTMLNDGHDPIAQRYVGLMFVAHGAVCFCTVRMNMAESNDSLCLRDIIAWLVRYIRVVYTSTSRSTVHTSTSKIEAVQWWSDVSAARARITMLRLSRVRSALFIDEDSVVVGGWLTVDDCSDPDSETVATRIRKVTVGV